jgi:hypothetical protein
MVEWKTSKTDKILEVGFVAKPLDESASLEIAGNKVTKLNKSDILCDGKVSYDEANKTLTLDNATITATKANAMYIYNVPDGEMTIKVKGTNNITCDKMHGIISMAKVHFEGAGAAPYLSIDVEANSSAYMAILVNAENMSVKDMTLLATTHHSGASVIAIGAATGELTVDNADLRAAIEDSPYDLAISGCSELKLKNGSVLRHDDVVWQMVTWNDSDDPKHFDGADLSHIWFGKNAEFPSDIEDAFVPAEKAVKVLRNGQIFILRGEHIYSITGQEIK